MPKKKTKVISNKDELREWFVQISKYDFKIPIIFEYQIKKPGRTLNQNAFYWAMLSDIKKHLYEASGKTFTEDVLHDYFRKLYLPSEQVEIGGEVVTSLTSTTKLNTQDMSDYLYCIQIHCREEFDLEIEIGEAHA